MNKVIVDGRLNKSFSQWYIVQTSSRIHLRWNQKVWHESVRSTDGCTIDRPLWKDTWIFPESFSFPCEWPGANLHTQLVVKALDKHGYGFPRRRAVLGSKWKSSFISYFENVWGQMWRPTRGKALTMQRLEVWRSIDITTTQAQLKHIHTSLVVQFHRWAQYAITSSTNTIQRQDFGMATCDRLAGLHIHDKIRWTMNRHHYTPTVDGLGRCSTMDLKSERL